MIFIKEIFENFNFYLNRKFKIRFFWIFILTLFASFIELIGIASLPLLVSSFFGSDLNFSLLEDFQKKFQINNSIIFISFLILFIFIFKNFYLSFVYFVENKFGRDFNLFIKKKLYGGYLTLPYSFYLKDNPSTFTRNILDDTENVNWYFNVLSLFLRENITVLFITSYLIFTDPITTISLLFFFSLIAYIFYFSLKNKILFFSENDLNYRREQLKSLNQSFESIENIKILNKYNFFKNKFSQFTYLKEKYSFYINYLNRLPKLILELAAILAIVFVIIKYSLDKYEFNDFIAYLTLLIVCIVRFIPAFTAITNCLVIIRKVKVSVDRLKKIIAEINISEADSKIVSKINGLENKIFKSTKIEINKVDFSYHNNQEKILNDLSLTIENNDSVALIGVSGSGKSTLVKILLGLLKPNAGQILFKNENIHDDIIKWHNNIGYIPQKIHLSDDTIKRNIAFGIEDDEIDEKKINDVIQLSNLNDFINHLPDKVNTIVGNQGSNISGGQLQRIGIARAIYRLPEVLIMDEATNALDHDTEKKVIESINKIKEIKIKIVISHRQSTVESCNKIFSLKNGSIIKIK
tara:strand:+ start:3177 stop:4916 length:1740 start_codon:yes stop_codon:yes gene_type:complete